MADRVVTEPTDDRPSETVVVKEGSRSSALWIILAILAFLLILFFVLGNPFASTSNDGTDVNVDVPAPTINNPAPNAPAE